MPLAPGDCSFSKSASFILGLPKSRWEKKVGNAEAFMQIYVFYQKYAGVESFEGKECFVFQLFDLKI